MAEEEVATVAVTEDMAVAEEDMVVDMVDTVDMVATDMAKRRETPMLSQKQMLLQKQMPIMVMEAMEADMADTVMVDMEGMDMAVNADLLSLDTDMGDMVVMEDTDIEAMDMEAMAMADMATMDKLVRINVHKPLSGR